MTFNHNKPWSPLDLERIKVAAQSIETKQQMYSEAPLLAKQFGRTESAICKKIEEIKGWFWK